jgi:hypothetical protein
MIRILLLTLAFLLPLAAQKYGGVLWVEVSKETVPAGGTAQLQVYLTEPKPIIRTRLELQFDDERVAEVLSAAVYSESGDAVGTATRRGNRLIITASSPSAELGWIEEYPIVTVNVRLRPGVEPGSEVKFDVLPSSEFYKRDGSPWTVEKYFTGGVTIGGELSIERLQPSGGMVKAGQVVKIFGQGFREDTHLEAPEVEGLTYRFISSTEMELVAERDFQLDQREILITNPESPEKEIYAAFEGKERQQSAWDTVSSAVPLFSHQLRTQASFTLPEEIDGENQFAAVALQNPNEEAALTRVYLHGPEGELLARAYVTVLGGERISRDLTELLPVSRAPKGAVVTVRADRPVQVVGLSGTHNTAEIRTVPLNPER